jgi:hypothetical protein
MAAEAGSVAGLEWYHAFQEYECGTGGSTLRRTAFIGDNLDLRTYLPTINGTVEEFAGRLSEAAETTGTDRVLLEEPLEVTSVLENVYRGRGSKIQPHTDGNDGVVLVFNTEGVGRAHLSSRAMGRKAHTRLRPGDAMVLPARVGDYDDPQAHQTEHEIYNITRRGLTRRSIAIVYDHAEELASLPDH